MFADDAYLSAVFYDHHETANTLNEGLEEISSWDERWNMAFNPNLTTERQNDLF